MAINQRGDVVGFANASEADGSNFNPRAFLWTRSQGIRNLGAVSGDITSQATGINEWRQIVGQSCDADDNCRGFLWQNGVMTDLQDLVVGDYDDVITTANDIDDLGRITGQAFDPDTGQFFAFVAKPVFD
jgi:probable HAF family extracellular repeat protein